MTDLALVWSNDTASADLAMLGADLATDDGLRTAILISLFTDARARDDDPLPAAPGGEVDRRGWWGDALPAVAGDVLGSRLWLLAREKRLASVAARAHDYATEALAWLIDDGVARSVDIEVDILGQQTLAFRVELVRPTGPGRLRFDYTWEATAHAV
jgi:phage gp46-like protein